MTRRPPTWPVIPLALPAAVSIWAGWVGLGQLTGFGVVQLLPGIWDELTINTAVTLPIGMESYAAYALYVWLHRGTPRRARNFARVSSIVALTLGALGQVAYHLMAASGVESAPWPITAAVACLPVAVLGMGATLAHLLTTDDEPVRRSAARPVAEPVPVDRPESVVDHPVSASTTPRFRPAVSAPPVGPPAAPVASFARVGDHPGHWSTTPRPPVDHPADREPVSVPAAGPNAPSAVTDPEVTEQVNGSAAQRRAVVDHPSTTSQPPVGREPDGPPVTTDDGPDPGASADSDDPLVDQVRAMVDQVRPPDRPPGRRAVARELDVTPYRASQLLAAATSAAPQNTNGTAREGTK